MNKLRLLAAAAMAAGALLLVAPAAYATATPEPEVSASASASVEVTASASASASASAAPSTSTSSSSAPASTPPSSATASATPTSTAPATVKPPTVSASASAGLQTPYYENCDAVEAALHRALLEGEPGYRPDLDSDHDGTACEALGVVPPGSSGGSTGGLPLTGFAAALVATGGVALVLVGVGMLAYLRYRNRVEFVAE